MSKPIWQYCKRRLGSNKAIRCSNDVEENSGPISISGERDMIYFRLITLRQAMEMEVKTGMVMISRSMELADVVNPFNIARKEFGIKGRNKSIILQRFNDLWEKLGNNGIVDLQLQYKSAITGAPPN